MPDMNVPFFRPSVGEAEIEAVSNCMRSGWLTTGPNAAAFEAEFVEMLGGGTEAIAVNSATAALHLGLDALGVGPGNEVILPTLTFTATAEVVRYMGATPVFVDIDPSTLCLNIGAVKEAITPNTRVIMPVHFAGFPCDLNALRSLADRHGLKIVDDAAHALPARQGGTLVGSPTAGADMTAFSFYANKTMTTGEGGMLVTADPDLARRARIMRLHGIDRDVFNRFSETKASWIYDVVEPGFKYNLNDMAAAMGRVQLARLAEFATTRANLVARYDAALKDLPLILPPHAPEGDLHSWHLYIIQIKDEAPLQRNTLIETLKASNIGCSVHYRPLHQMTVWKPMAQDHAFPASDAYFQRCISLPLFMDMRADEQNYVVEALRNCLL